jgi:hypothetical protein
MSRRSRESPIIAVEAQFISLTPSVQSSAHTDVCQLPSLDFCQAPGQTETVQTWPKEDGEVSNARH